MFDDTIAAIATPLATGAISIIRLSGPDAIAITDRLFSRSLENAPSHTIQYGFLLEDGQPVDEVLISLFRAPRSYTCEDVVEINAHGGPLVTRKILGLLLKNGARLARPGEFTQRAFLNGRIDLSQAEAVEEMIEAATDAARKQAIGSIRGSIRQLLEPLIDDLMDLIANIEVNIDYPEYDDVEQLTADKLLPRSQALEERMKTLLKRSKSGAMIIDGIKTVIVGKPNVGKSSLLNALLQEEKAIVTDIAGTTRDLVEGRVQIGPFALNLIDTAGIRENADQIEQIGIEKSRQSLEEADLVLLVLDGSRKLEEQDKELLEATAHKRRIVLVNKSDLPQAFVLDEALPVSAQKHDLSTLPERIEDLFESSRDLGSACLTNERQIGLLEMAHVDMMRAIEAMKLGTEPDLIEIDLVAAHDHLKEILGEVHREDLLDTLFTNFCLGK